MAEQPEAIRGENLTLPPLASPGSDSVNISEPSILAHMGSVIIKERYLIDIDAPIHSLDMSLTIGEK